jgi:hypothetical protein
MLDFPNINKFNSHLPVITENLNILHFDEFPILFSGTNKYGNKLIGSFSYEDYDNDVFRYFVLIVEDSQFVDFHQGEKSYLNIIEESDEIFIVDKDFEGRVLSSFQVPTSWIPLEYLPERDSFIPEVKRASPLFQFSFSLKGKLANLHRALVKDINDVNERISLYLEESLSIITQFNLKPKVYSRPSQVGSYRLNFNIEIQKEIQPTFFPVNHQLLGVFFNEYLNYVLNSLPHEPEDLFFHGIHTDKFEALMEQLTSIYNNANLKPSEQLSYLLARDINNSAIKLIEVSEFLKDNESFNMIETGRIDKSGMFTATGLLQESYKDLVYSKVNTAEQKTYLIAAPEKQVDEAEQSYRILVYKLNVYTGKGLARLYQDETETFRNVTLHILSNGKNISNSIFTNSINEEKVIEVKGRATKTDGVYTKLDCSL